MTIADIFKDKSGSIVITQFPNWPLWSFLVFSLFGLIDSRHTFSYWGATVSLVYWSYLEITQGVNLFRKGLGVFVLIFLIVTRIHLIILQLQVI